MKANTRLAAQLLGTAILACAAGNRPTTVLASEPGRPRGKAFELVEMLASPNMPPNLGAKRGFADLKPSYDLKAQDRVNSAWQELVETREDAIPALIEGLNDKRYCTTAAPYSMYVDYTVGDICRKILASRLEFYRSFDAFRPPLPEKGPSYIDAHFKDPDSGRKWIEARKGKALWEIQVDVLEWLIADERRHPFRNIYTEARVLGPVYYLADHIRRTKEPVPPFDPFFIVPKSRVP